MNGGLRLVNYYEAAILSILSILSFVSISLSLYQKNLDNKKAIDKITIEKFDENITLKIKLEMR